MNPENAIYQPLLQFQKNLAQKLKITEHTLEDILQDRIEVEQVVFKKPSRAERQEEPMQPHRMGGLG